MDRSASLICIAAFLLGILLPVAWGIVCYKCHNLDPIPAGTAYTGSDPKCEDATAAGNYNETGTNCTDLSQCFSANVTFSYYDGATLKTYEGFVRDCLNTSLTLSAGCVAIDASKAEGINLPISNITSASGALCACNTDECNAGNPVVPANNQGGGSGAAVTQVSMATILGPLLLYSYTLFV